jgi:hypothetical protein
MPFFGQIHPQIPNGTNRKSIYKQKNGNQSPIGTKQKNMVLDDGVTINFMFLKDNLFGFTSS